MRDRYPEIEPSASGLLDVGDGHRLYWETCGNPDGAPGARAARRPRNSGCGPGIRRYFDPARYRIVLFDQRGCGRSLPSAGDPVADLAANTTRTSPRRHRAPARPPGHRALAAVRRVVGLRPRPRVRGAPPGRVSAIVMMGIATGRRAETDLLSRGLGRLFPDAWVRFRDHVPAAERDGDLVAAYARLLADPDPAVHQAAADEWCRWEDAPEPGIPGHSDEDPQLAARIRPPRHPLLEPWLVAGGGRGDPQCGAPDRHPGRTRTGDAGPREPRSGRRGRWRRHGRAWSCAWWMRPTRRAVRR